MIAWRTWRTWRAEVDDLSLVVNGLAATLPDAGSWQGGTHSPALAAVLHLDEFPLRWQCGVLDGFPLTSQPASSAWGSGGLARKLDRSRELARLSHPAVNILRNGSGQEE